MKQAIYFTKKGLEDKQKEYEELLASRPAAVQDLAKAREMGDLSENGYYKSARMKLSDVDRHLRQLKHILQIAKVKEATGDMVDIGSKITVKTGESTKVFEIVGTYEANPSLGKISSSSPLGKLFLGKKVGETVVFSYGEHTTMYSILFVE